MQISNKTLFWAASCLMAGILFSCATTKDTARTNATPAENANIATETKPTQPAPPVYTRVSFGEQLESLLTQGNYDAAIALFDTVPSPDSEELSIRLLKLSVLLSAGKNAESSALAAELSAQYPDNTDVLYVQAILAGAKNDAAARTAYLNKILKIDPKHGRATTELGLDFLAKGSYTQAKPLFIKAISLEAGNTDALLGLARVYYMQSDLAKAGNTLNLALEKSPEYSVLWAERARVKSETGDLAGAIEDMMTAIKLDPRVYGHWTDIGGYLITAGKKEEARAAYTEAIKLKPDQYLAYIYRAGLNDDLGDTDGAINDYTKVCVTLPEYYFAAEGLGILLWGKGNYAGSQAAFEQALSWSPKNTSYALMITLCMYRQNKQAEAKQFMGKFITKLDRNKTEYYVCRLFVDKSGDADVLNRITKEKDISERNKMLFYSAMYYDLFQSKAIAEKYYIEIKTMQAPGFFEYRLAEWALRDLENGAASGSSKTDGNAATPEAAEASGTKA
jgi:tetratricopeptide (TPR) repeat protein